MFNRIIKPLKTNSFFLFGARGTGKSTFLKDYFKEKKVLWIDLLDLEQERRLALRPTELKDQIQTLHPHLDWVVIDEVQKLPRLLDLVHQLIETTPLLFALTGSSARKLRHGAANLLAGRAFVYHLFPLTHVEMGAQFDLNAALQWGTLPRVTQLPSAAEKRAYLKAYALTYFKEEVQAEQLIRNLDPFRQFLDIAAQCNGEIINYTNIARDVGVDVKTVQSYFQILEDTLLGTILNPYHTSVRKQQRQSPKFYFFDMGIVRALSNTLGQEITPSTYGYGRLFEQFILIEAMRLNAYYDCDFKFYYLRTKNQVEIDLIIERPGLPIALVEIKSSERVDDRDTHSLNHFLKDFKGADAYCLSRDPIPKKIGSVHALPWQQGFQEIGLVTSSKLIAD